MRRVRPEATASVRQVRTATLWAFAFSAGAAVSALAIPLLVMHAVATLNGHVGRHTFALLAAAALAALLVRGVFLSARGRILARAALWLSHALGAQVLAHGLDAVRSPNDLDRDRSSLDHVARALPTLAAMFDAVLIILPLAIVFVLSPVLGLVSIGAVGAMMCAALHLFATMQTQFKAIDGAQAEADGAWRTAAASSVVIAARGMTARVVGDWQSLNGRAIARGYGAAQSLERARSIVSSIRHLALVALLTTAVFVLDASHLGLGALAAILLLHEGALRTLSVAIEQLPAMLAARRHLNGLMVATPHALGSSQTIPAHAAPVPRPMPDRQAVAS